METKYSKLVAIFVNIGFKDYIAARILLNQKACLQGAILASTAVEKYFKAIIALRGIKITGHLNRALINTLKNTDPKLYKNLNSSFLDLLIKIYKLRYLDEIKPNFNLAISCRAILAELDYTITTIEKKIIFKNKSSLILKKQYDSAIDEKKTELFFNNYLLNNIVKNDFLKQPDTTYELRVDTNMGIVEIYYDNLNEQVDDNFNRIGLAPLQWEK